LEKQVEEYKKNQEMEFQNYCTSNPAEYAKAKREATDISEQNSKASRTMYDKIRYDMMVITL
jgi:hypothetical protein